LSLFCFRFLNATSNQKRVSQEAPHKTESFPAASDFGLSYLPGTIVASFNGDGDEDAAAHRA
jgi:hypothetical protein